MKQKIVLKVAMRCEKCRKKALQITAEATGVNSLQLEGGEKEKLVVIGDGVDAVKLASKLRKNVGHTEIVSVAEAGTISYRTSQKDSRIYDAGLVSSLMEHNRLELYRTEQVKRILESTMLLYNVVMTSESS